MDGGTRLFEGKQRTRIPLYAGNKSGLQRLRAYEYALRLAVHQNAHFLYVNAVSTASSVIRVRLVVAGTWLLPCDITFTSH